jgi:hypothetical protein
LIKKALGARLSVKEKALESKMKKNVK